MEFVYSYSLAMHIIIQDTKFVKKFSLHKTLQIVTKQTGKSY